MNETARLVRGRAADRCEYCGMHQCLQGATFHVEHVIPKFRGGRSDLDNLAWSCPTCNMKKSTRVAMADPDSGDLVPLFNPRLDAWTTHFRFEGFLVVGNTAVGRATISALDLNHPSRLNVRRAERRLGL